MAVLGFPDSSVGKESACNAGDPCLIPGWGRSVGEGIGYPLQYSWASLVAQLVKNPPAIQETWVWSLGWEDPLEKGKATHSGILAWRTPWYSPWHRKESDPTERVLLSRLCWVFTAVWKLSLDAASGASSLAAVHGTAPCGIFLLLQSPGPVVVAHRLSCPEACGIFLEQGLSRVPCIGRWSLNHWTTRAIPG